MLVDRVEGALHANRNSSKGSDYSMSDSEGSEEDVEMEEEPKGCLTLGKFQEDLRKEALAQKGGQHALVTQRKGGLEGNGEGSR